MSALLDSKQSTFFVFLHSIVCHCANHLVSNWCQQRGSPHVFRLLPLHRMGGHCFLLTGWRDANVLVRFLYVLVSHLPGQQPLLLLKTGRCQPASSLLQQSCQKCPCLRMEILCVHFYLQTFAQNQTKIHDIHVGCKM